MSEDNLAPSVPEDESNPTVQDIPLEERELALKEREATLKEIETKYRLNLEKRNVWFTSPLLIAVFSTLFGILGTAVGSILQGYWNFQLERQKFEFSLIQKSLETDEDRLIGNHGDRQESAKKLIFLVDSGIIKSLDGESLRRLAKDPGNLPVYTPRNNSQTRFECKIIDNTPTTVAKTSRGDTPIISWEKKGFKNSNGDCNEVSRRFQEAHANGLLSYLTSGTIEDKVYICANKNIKSTCDFPLFQLNSSEKPETILKELLQVRSFSSNPLVR